MGAWREQAREWLEREDTQQRKDRIKRLAWLASLAPRAEYLGFPGGWMTKFLYEEARYCFVYGQYLATIVLGLAFIERSLAAVFYGAGEDEAEGAPAAHLYEKALEFGLLSAADHASLDEARRLRNAIVHFRRPPHKDTLEYRAVTGNELPYDILEKAARNVLRIVMRFVAMMAV